MAPNNGKTEAKSFVGCACRVIVNQTSGPINGWKRLAPIGNTKSGGRSETTGLHAWMKSHGFGRLARAAAAILVVLLVGATFRAGVQKGLVGTIGLQEWGRYLFGIGAALTQSRWGIGGYVIDSPIEQKLQTEGLTDNPNQVKALGLAFP